MGFTPKQIGEMSLWEYLSALEGYVKANSSDESELTAKEVDDLWDWIKTG